jgi:GNAT superfamily N-acetyltransferase
MPRFPDLIAQEHEVLGCESPDKNLVIGNPGASDEPRVADTSVQLFGIALSGGGIRSATFNLGLLQALAELGVLRHADYLATVSGGGYIGGWWSAWRRRAGPGKTFPAGPEADHELRHLREFSKYLAPRWSIGELDSWLFIATAAAIMLPALFATCALVSMLALVFHGAAELVIFNPAPVRAASTGFLTYAILAAYDWLWHRRTAPELATVAAPAFHAFALLAGGCAGACSTLFELTAIPERAMFLPFGDNSPNVLLILLRPTWCWLGAYGVLVCLRFLLTRAGSWQPSVPLRGKLDRVNARLFTLACAWTAMALLWEGGRWLSTYSFFAVAGEPLLLGVLFVVFWSWRASKAPPNAPRAPGVWREVRNVMPLGLAYCTLIVGLTSMVSLLIRGFRDWQLSEWALAAIALGGVLLVVFLFDTAESGLHSAVRARTARAYLGSQPVSTGNALTPNRAVEAQPGDDFPMRDLRHLGKPLHLVCCAANDLSGDPLRNLNRGARSATVSALGLAIGDSYVPWRRECPTLGSLITASAASFNPNMGAVSMQTGPVMRFLVTALNLRLGLWLPAVTRGRVGALVDRWLPGRLFYAEMLGLTRADLKYQVHLSDGAHFDNTGIYELIRRRCRFILLSDCSEDLRVTFDDIGNAIRKVRQDFDIEVRIDLAPLRLDRQGLSKQHVAVGEIEYAPDDMGTLIVIKPSLTGDEPVDVQQYGARNARFPHEPTRNQFYDAAQWESYRRLGYHAAASAFSIVDRLGGELSAARVFAALRVRWYPTPDDLTTGLLGLTQRFSEFEHRVRQAAPPRLQLELFPELREIDAVGASDDPEPTLAENQVVLNLLLQFTQLMEDVWLGCRLETHWSHPLNSGWMSYFHRWTSTPSFRMWWPILRPLFSRGLRRFAKERFELSSPGDDLSAPDAEPTFGEVQPMTSGFGERLASRAWLDAGLPRPREDEHVFQYLLYLRRNPDDVCAVQAAVVALESTEDEAGPAVRWQSQQFFVAPSLRGSGIERAFLLELLRTLREQGFNVFRVVLPAMHGTDSAAERARRDLLEFYVREGFVRAPGEKNVLVLRDKSSGTALARVPRPGI